MCVWWKGAGSGGWFGSERVGKMESGTATGMAEQSCYPAWGLRGRRPPVRTQIRVLDLIPNTSTADSGGAVPSQQRPPFECIIYQCNLVDHLPSEYYV